MEHREPDRPILIVGFADHPRIAWAHATRAVTLLRRQRISVGEFVVVAQDTEEVVASRPV
jgi:hypothetical protein